MQWSTQLSYDPPHNTTTHLSPNISTSRFEPEHSPQGHSVVHPEIYMAMVSLRYRQGSLSAQTCCHVCLHRYWRTEHSKPCLSSSLSACGPACAKCDMKPLGSPPYVGAEFMFLCTGNRQRSYSPPHERCLCDKRRQRLRSSQSFRSV